MGHIAKWLVVIWVLWLLGAVYVTVLGLVLQRMPENSGGVFALVGLGAIGLIVVVSVAQKLMRRS